LGMYDKKRGEGDPEYVLLAAVIVKSQKDLINLKRGMYHTYIPLLFAISNNLSQ
jgi:hypothetical protein